MATRQAARVRQRVLPGSCRNLQTDTADVTSAGLLHRTTVSATVATAAASGVWTASILLLASSGRTELVGLLLAAELLGSLLGRVLERVPPGLRHRSAVVVYTLVRALLIPLVVFGAGAAVLVLVSLSAGGAWRVLSASFTATAAGDGRDGRSRRVASLSALTSIGALAGTGIAGIAYDVQPIYWAAGSLLVLSALFVPVQELRGNSPAGKTSLPSPLAAAAAVATVAVNTAPRFAPIVIAAALSPAWVGPAAALAAVSKLAAPPLVGRTDEWSLAKILVLAALAAGVWLIAPYGALVLAAWALSNVIGGVVDAQLDTRSAHGSDPAATAARMQTLQAGAGAAAGVGASYLLAEASVVWLALSSALLAFSVAAVLLVIDRRGR